MSLGMPDADTVKKFFSSVASSNVAVVKELIGQYGVKIVNYRNEDKWTPLMHASRWARVEVVELLLKHGAELDAEDRKGETALFPAVCFDRPAVVKALLKAGASVDHSDSFQLTPLGVAIMDGYPETVSLLLQHGADKNRQPESDTTPLMLTAVWNRPVITEILLRAGADMQIENAGGKTARMLAEAKGHGDVVAVLDRQVRADNQHVGQLASVRQHKMRVRFRVRT